MKAVEFWATPEDGIIRIPAGHRKRFNGPVRVILLQAEEDGIVHGAPLAPKVTKVEALEDWRLRLTFKDGKTGIFDMKPLRRGVFSRLEDPDYFKRVRIVDGCIEWPDGQDLHYDMLYHKSQSPGREQGR